MTECIERVSPGNVSDRDTHRAYSAARARYHLAIAEHGIDDDAEAIVDRLSDEHEAALHRLMFGLAADMRALAFKLQVFRDDDLTNHRLANVFIAALAEDAQNLASMN
jgi:hypothetical protein